MGRGAYPGTLPGFREHLLGVLVMDPKRPASTLEELDRLREVIGLGRDCHSPSGVLEVDAPAPADQAGPQHPEGMQTEEHHARPVRAPVAQELKDGQDGIRRRLVAGRVEQQIVHNLDTNEDLPSPEFVDQRVADFLQVNGQRARVNVGGIVVGGHAEFFQGPVLLQPRSSLSQEGSGFVDGLARACALTAEVVSEAPDGWKS
jgi:hypothetical protein